MTASTSHTPAPPDPSASEPPARRDRYRQTLGWALAASALVHVVAILLYPHLFGRLPPAQNRGTPDATRPPTGTEIINLVEVAGEEARPETPPPERRPELQPPPTPTEAREAEPSRAPPVLSPPGVRPGAPGEEEGWTTAERLRPTPGDPRLWAPLPEEITELSPEQRMENLLYGRLQALNDSAAIEAERARRATDWTYTDGDGNKWGVSPGKLHLGPITIPLPFSFGMPPGASDDMHRRQSQDAEIRRAAGQGAVDETNEERAKAIRKRMDEERKKRKADPDTTSGGGGG